MVIVITGTATVANGNVAQGLAATESVVVARAAMMFAVVMGETVVEVIVVFLIVAMVFAVIPGKTAATVVVAVVIVALTCAIPSVVTMMTALIA